MKKLTTFIICIILLAGGAAIARHFINTRPKAKRAKPEKVATLVDVISAKAESRTVTVSGTGVVIPARELQLTSEIGGRIVSMSDNLVPGAYFGLNEEILKIDKGNYEAALKLKKSQLADAAFNLQVEQGQQVIAKEEWEFLDQDFEKTEIGQELALRRPHLIRARAALESAEIAVDRAQYNVDRATIKAPFNAVVINEFVEKEQLVTTQTKIATLVGTDSFRVRVSLPVDRLGWIKFPDNKGEGGAEATVVQQSSLGKIVEKQGRVVRVLGDLETAGRMARLLIEVADPLGLKSGDYGTSIPLFLGAYVSTEISGRQLENVITLPESAVHDGDKVWIMDKKDMLEIRKIDITWRCRGSVLIEKGIKPGERIVISQIPTAIPGMLLRTGSSKSGVK